MEDAALTEDEAKVLDFLGDAADHFAALRQEHPSDLTDFVFAIHAAQNIVLARSGYRSYRALKNLDPDWKRP